MRASEMQSQRFPVCPRIVVMTMIAIVFCGVMGCGPSKKDMLLRAAQRVKSDKANNGDEKKPAKKKPAKKKEEKVAVAPPPNARLGGKVEKKEETKEVEKEVVKKDIKELIPISERKRPAGDGRSIAAGNLTKVGSALLELITEKNFIPRRAIRSEQRVNLLSWRVQLLPYLGYPELYAKFDLTKPWYMEPNKSLLEYIPDEIRLS